MVILKIKCLVASLIASLEIIRYRSKWTTHFIYNGGQETHWLFKVEKKKLNQQDIILTYKTKNSCALFNLHAHTTLVMRVHFPKAKHSLLKYFISFTTYGNKCSMGLNKRQSKKKYFLIQRLLLKKPTFSGF